MMANNNTVSKKCNKSSGFWVYRTSIGSTAMAFHAFSGVESSGFASRISWASFQTHSR